MKSNKNISPIAVLVILFLSVIGTVFLYNKYPLFPSSGSSWQTFQTRNNAPIRFKHPSGWTLKEDSGRVDVWPTAETQEISAVRISWQQDPKYGSVENMIKELNELPLAGTEIGLTYKAVQKETIDGKPAYIVTAEGLEDREYTTLIVIANGLIFHFEKNMQDEASKGREVDEVFNKLLTTVSFQKP